MTDPMVIGSERSEVGLPVRDGDPRTRWVGTGCRRGRDAALRGQPGRQLRRHRRTAQRPRCGRARCVRHGGLVARLRRGRCGAGLPAPDLDRASGAGEAAPAQSSRGCRRRAVRRGERLRACRAADRGGPTALPQRAGGVAGLGRGREHRLAARRRALPPGSGRAREASRAARRTVGHHQHPRARRPRRAGRGRLHQRLSVEVPGACRGLRDPRRRQLRRPALRRCCLHREGRAEHAGHRRPSHRRRLGPGPRPG